MQDLPTFDLHHHKDIEDSEAKRYRDQEMSSYDRPGMVPDDGHPALGGRGLPGAEILRPIGPHGSWRNADAELEGQFRGSPRLAPGRILPHHLCDESAEVSRQSRPAAVGLPAPEKLKCPPMPTDESFRLYDHKGIAQIEPPRPEKQREPGRIGPPVGHDVSF